MVNCDMSGHLGRDFPGEAINELELTSALLSALRPFSRQTQAFRDVPTMPIDMNWSFSVYMQNKLETERQILLVLQSTEPCVDQPHHHHASGEFLFEVGPVRQEFSTLMQQTTAGCSPKNQQKTNSVSRNDDSKFCWFSAMTPSLPIQQWFVSVVNHQKKSAE